jgi:UDP-3-O-[3-hydroxymyristoyl] glucosamine N-acyltransferase
MKHTAESIAKAVGARLVGDGTREVRRVAGIEAADEFSLVFVESERYLDAALQSRAGAVVAGEFAASATAPVPLLIAAQPKLAFTRAARILQPKEHSAPGIHATAVLDPSANLGADVCIEAHAVIGANVTIGEGTRIGAGTVMAAGVRIGAGCDIGANVSIYSGSTLGDHVVVHAGAVLGSDGFGYVRDKATGRYEQFPQVGTLEVYDDVEIGANTTIDRGALGATVIGRGTKIDNLCQIGHNVRLGENVVIAALVGISGSVEVGNNVVMAGQVGIADHARIEDGVILGARAAVATGKVLRGAGTVYVGFPARPLREFLREQARSAKEKK